MLGIHWIVIVILAIVGFTVIKMNDLKHRFFILLLIFFALFFYTSIVFISDKNSFDLSTSEGVFAAIKVYMGWLANGFHNLKSLAGKAVEMDWKATNSSFSRR
jgi:ABC-type multidrug transport system permease subunit